MEDRSWSIPDGLKPKDLLGLPWRVALALQADGWYLRSDIIWSKPNPMPESVRDRPTRAHEYVFLFSKQERYYYDGDAIKTPPAEVIIKRRARADLRNKVGYQDAYFGNPPMRPQAKDKQRGHSRRHDGFNDRWDQITKQEQQALGANARSVWEIATQPYKGAHFATFPEELARRCILAGCPPGGTVLDPFAGSGTTGQVARFHGRNAVLIEGNPKYCELIRERVETMPRAMRKGKGAK